MLNPASSHSLHGGRRGDVTVYKNMPPKNWGAKTLIIGGIVIAILGIAGIGATSLLAQHNSSLSAHLVLNRLGTIGSIWAPVMVVVGGLGGSVAVLVGGVKLHRARKERQLSVTLKDDEFTFRYFVEDQYILVRGKDLVNFQEKEAREFFSVGKDLYAPIPDSNIVIRSDLLTEKKKVMEEEDLHFIPSPDYAALIEDGYFPNDTKLIDELDAKRRHLNSFSEDKIISQLAPFDFTFLLFNDDEFVLIYMQSYNPMYFLLDGNEFLSIDIIKGNYNLMANSKKIKAKDLKKTIAEFPNFGLQVQVDRSEYTTTLLDYADLVVKVNDNNLEPELNDALPDLHLMD